MIALRLHPLVHTLTLCLSAGCVLFSPGFLLPAAPPARRILQLQILASRPLSIFFGP